MSAPLNPQQLTPEASLNRVQLSSRNDWEPGLSGKTGYDLLSLQALTDELVQHAPELGASLLTAERAQLPQLFDNCFEAVDPRVRVKAEAIGDDFGRRLAYLILTLKLGEPASRQARPDWDASYWTHWAQTKQIWLGGGLVAGHFGQRVCAASQAVLDEHMESDCRLQLATWPSLLPLIGCARSTPADIGVAVVFDFGQSFVKRASARYEDGRLTALDLLPVLPVPWDTIGSPNQADREQALSLANYMSQVIGETWQLVHQQDLDPSADLFASVASYVIDNQPLPRQGGPYAQLHVLADNVGDWLASNASSAVGQALRVTLLHDGTAAARTYAGEERAAVIMLGTALGIGFPPTATALRPIAPGFQVEGESRLNSGL